MLTILCSALPAARCRQGTAVTYYLQQNHYDPKYNESLNINIEYKLLYLSISISIYNGEWILGRELDTAYRHFCVAAVEAGVCYYCCGTETNERSWSGDFGI